MEDRSNSVDDVVLQARSPEGDSWMEVTPGDFRKAKANGYETRVLYTHAAPAVDAAELGKLKALAEAAKDWKWQTVQGDQFGHFEEGSFYDIGTIDADQYAIGEECHNETVLNFVAACDPAAILRIAALVAQLEGENDRLRGALGDEVAAATLLTDISIANGGLNATYEGGAAQMLAEQFAEQFRQSGATNYLEIGVASRKDGMRLLVTLQRCDGKTPATFKAEAEALVAQQAARIEAMRAAGAKMANTMFNLAQMQGREITEELALKLKDMQREWDAAIHATQEGK